MGETKVFIPKIEKVKTKTETVVEKNADDDETERRLVTVLTIRCDASPKALAGIHELMKMGADVALIIGSAQGVLPLSETEGVLAEG